MMIKFKVCCFSVMELMNQFSVRARFFQKNKKQNVTRCPARFNWPHKLERGSLFLRVSNPWKMNAGPKSVSLIGGLIRWPTGTCLPPAGFQNPVLDLESARVESTWLSQSLNSAE